MENEIYKCETELMELEFKLSQKRDKMQRLKAAYYCVKNEFDQLQMVVKKFQAQTILSTSGNIAGVDQCIAAVEEYMSTY